VQLLSACDEGPDVGTLLQISVCPSEGRTLGGWKPGVLKHTRPGRGGGHFVA
jgi:hypothetical protein